MTTFKPATWLLDTVLPIGGLFQFNGLYCEAVSETQIQIALAAGISVQFSLDKEPGKVCLAEGFGTAVFTLGKHGHAGMMSVSCELVR